MRSATLFNTALSGLVAAVAIGAHPSGAQEDAEAVRLEIAESTVDYAGFAELVAAVEPYRAGRLVSLAEFNRMAAEPGTIILDTRSAEAFEAGHVAGAIHLNFSDFTAAKLAKVIPSPDTRILIYCNNNFRDNVAPVPVKSAPLALNVPTFVNLYGYGYDNIYELADLVGMEDGDLNWVTSNGQPAG